MNRSEMRRSRIGIVAIAGVTISVLFVTVVQPFPSSVQQACRPSVSDLIDCKELGRGITLTLSVDKSSYKVGEEVRIKWTITNANPNTVVLGVPLNSFMVDTTIFNETGKKPVWAQPSVILIEYEGIVVERPVPIIKDTTFGPRESLTNEVVWNTTMMRAECSGGQGNIGCNSRNAGSAPSGEYTTRLTNVRVVLVEGQSRKGIGLLYPEHLSVKFRILEPSGLGEDKKSLAEGKPAPSNVSRLTAMSLTCLYGWFNGDIVGGSICKEGPWQFDSPQKFNMASTPFRDVASQTLSGYEYYFGIEVQAGQKMRLLVDSTAPVDLVVTFTEGAKIRGAVNVKDPSSTEILSKKQITSINQELTAERRGLFQFDLLHGDRDPQSGRWPLSNATVTFVLQKLP